MKIGLISDNFVEYNGKIYSFSIEFNILCEIDIETQSSLYIGSIPEEKFLCTYLVGGIVIYDNTIYLIPHNAKNMWMYHIDKKLWEKCLLPSIEENQKRKFNNAFIFGKYIFMIGYLYNGIVVYDVQNKEEKVLNIFSEIEHLYKKEEGYIRKDILLQDETMYAPCMYANYILKLNLNQYDDWKWIKLNDNYNKGYSGITYDGYNFILSPRFGKGVVLWNENTGICEKIIDVLSNELFLGAYWWNRSIYIPGKDKTESIFINENEINKKKESLLCAFENNNILFSQTVDGILNVYSSTNTIFSNKIYVDVEKKEIDKLEKNSPILLYETNRVSLDSFLNYVIY